MPLNYRSVNPVERQCELLSDIFDARHERIRHNPIPRVKWKIPAFGLHFSLPLVMGLPSHRCCAACWLPSGASSRDKILPCFVVWFFLLCGLILPALRLDFSYFAAWFFLLCGFIFPALRFFFSCFVAWFFLLCGFIFPALRFYFSCFVAWFFLLCGFIFPASWWYFPVS